MTRLPDPDNRHHPVLVLTASAAAMSLAFLLSTPATALIAGPLGGLAALAALAWKKASKSWYFPWAFLPA